MKHRGTSRWLAIGMSFVLGCVRPDALSSSGMDPEFGASPEVTARALRAEISQGRLPAGVENTVHELLREAERARSPSGSSGLKLAAADLVFARYQLARDPSDLERSRALYEAVSMDPGALGCVGLERLVRVFTQRAEARQTMTAREAHRARCVHARDAGIAAHRPATVHEGTPRAAVQRVVLDPGHGGSDPGALGPSGLSEAEVNLDVARRVADRLSMTYGVQVVLTRDRDVYIDLEDRAAQANASGADLFVSVHCNASGNTEAHGISTFVLETTDDRINARVIAREGELVAMPTGDLPRILANLRLSSQGSLSFSLASRLQEAMLHDVRLFHPEVTDMGVHPAHFQVLVTARMPAVLVELSFISNPEEERRLRTDSYRDVLASALARAIAAR